MGVYARKDSPFWYLWIDGTKIRQNTKIPVGVGYQRKDSRRKAEDVYNAIMGDRARQRFELPADRPQIGFSDFATWYYENIGRHHRGHRRVKSIVRNLTAHFGARPLDTLDAPALEEWKTQRATHVKKETVNRELDVLKPLLRSAVPKYLKTSPADQVKRFRTRRFPPVTVFSFDAEDKLLAIASPAERALYLLGTDALLRFTDARTLKIEHDHGTYLEIVDPKTGTPYKVPTSTRLRAALVALRTTARAQGGFYFGRRYKGGWHAMGEATAYEMFKALCVRAGVPSGRKAGGVTFHSTRHTGTSRAMRATKATAVMKLGGWASLRQLARYDHPDDPDLILGVEAIGSRPTLTTVEKRKKPPISERLKRS